MFYRVTISAFLGVNMASTWKILHFIVHQLVYLFQHLFGQTKEFELLDKTLQK